jgi:hypothetical protein
VWSPEDGRIQQRGAVPGGEVAAAGEAGDVAEQAGRAGWPYAVQLLQGARLFGHSRIVGLSQVPVSNRAVRPYERRLGSQRPPALSTVDGMIEASPGVEPEVTRFADGALRPERHEAVRASDGFEPPTSRFGTWRSFR